MSKRLRRKTVLLSERNLMFVIGGQLYAQAPNHKPRKIEIIMDKIQKKFREDCLVSGGDWHYKYINENKLFDYVHATLFSIPEFEELNLSQNEYEAGIKVNDDSRAKYNFCSAYDVATEDSWKDDFIDLDAFVRNVDIELRTKLNDNDDCFFCINKDTEECKTCSLNKNFKSNYRGDRTPKGDYTISCAFDCVGKGYAICCVECQDKSICKFKCLGDPDSCGSVCACKVDIKNEEDNK